MHLNSKFLTFILYTECIIFFFFFRGFKFFSSCSTLRLSELIIRVCISSLSKICVINDVIFSLSSINLSKSCILLFLSSIASTESQFTSISFTSSTVTSITLSTFIKPCVINL
ncbi:hypothetical protein Hanom_Chr12g01083731 [Helianthus anomalus]